jgi:hypothetical protein
MTLEFSRQIFEKKKTHVKFHRNPYSGSRVVFMKTDRRTNMTEANSRFPQFCANAPKNDK